MRPTCCCCRQRPAGAAGKEGRVAAAWARPGGGTHSARRGPGPAGAPVLRENPASWRKRCAPVPLVKSDAQCNAPARVLSHRPPLPSPLTLLGPRELPGHLFWKKLGGRNLKWEFEVCFSPLSAFRGPLPSPHPS